MTIARIFADPADYLRSNEFLHNAQSGDHPTAFTCCRTQLNDWLVARFELRASHVVRAPATNQIAYVLFLHGAGLMLAASLHEVHDYGEPQILFEHLDRLGSTNLLLYRGYPGRWLVATLNQRGIPFCMRIVSTGFACVRDFLRTGLVGQVVTRRVPDQHDARDNERLRQAHAVRLARTVAGNERVSVLMTSLLDTERFPVAHFTNWQTIRQNKSVGLRRKVSNTENYSTES